MKVLPVVNNNDGSWVVGAPIPETAIQTDLTPDGCTVYEVGDEEALAASLAELEQQ